MIKLNISGVHAELDKDIKKYVGKKIGKLDRYMTRQVSKSVHAEVKLKEAMRKTRKECTAEVVLHMPKETITVKETTINMYAAVDIVEAKLRNQLKKYKETHGSPRQIRHLLGRLKRKSA
jgi:putative sigma-54 modulation protein